MEDLKYIKFGGFWGEIKYCLTWSGKFADPSDKQVDVVDIVVDKLEPVDNLGWDKVDKVVDTLNPLQTTQFTESIVTFHMKFGKKKFLLEILTLYDVHFIKS